MLTADWRFLEELAGDAALPRARRQSRVLIISVALIAMIAMIAVADYFTGFEIRLTVLYLLPIGMATYLIGGLAGTLASIIASLCWLTTFETTHLYSRPIYFYWEGGMTIVTFLVVVALLTRLKRALEHSDQRFVTVVEGLAAAVFVEDPRSGQILFANPRHREKFGLARPAMLAPDLTDAFAGELHDASANRWFLVRSRPLRWVNGCAATLRLLSDITEEKRVRELMERHRDALHRSARLVALGEFASAIAHELNQPLTAIATYNNSSLRLIESGRGDSPELRQAMEKCRDQAKRAGAIIQRLRDLLRQPTPDFGAQDLNAVARAAREAMEVEALECGVTLELALATGLPPVRADALLVEQVLLNLVRNAIEAVQGLAPHRRRVTIGSAVCADGSVALSVSDAGEGLPDEIRERLFFPFVSDKPGGLGLGLSICRSVIESHGGGIACESSAAGTRFAITLPAAAQ